MEQEIENVQGQTEAKKFVYKRSGIDMGIVLIFILTILVFGLIYFVSVYFERQNNLSNVEQDSQYRELLEQRDELIEQLEQYQSDPDLNRDN